ncbi:DUF397 domain-containing protein [Streptomyces sp. WAC 01529]|uniref:DUF397 domain-containing protein n=1 Tax=Streptomyces sp. WAC 01529 TaxID=2203205 RepID=UPI000F7177AC|nr:DUF397 domain-containing protein [Streptomyces sp. WAC 01529]AZM53963.1 DUF397 domain-containing protein [Streptomyces sp. WAC 01529]
MKSTSPEYDLSTATWHKSSYSDASGGNCLEVATWRKSTHSGGDGGNCLEVADTWRKSTHSGGEGGNCLEVSDGHPEIVPVRDSKNPQGPHLIFQAAAWSAFLDEVKAP